MNIIRRWFKRQSGDNENVNSDTYIDGIDYLSSNPVLPLIIKYLDRNRILRCTEVNRNVHRTIKHSMNIHLRKFTILRIELSNASVNKTKEPYSMITIESESYQILSNISIYPRKMYITDSPAQMKFWELLGDENVTDRQWKVLTDNRVQLKMKIREWKRTVHDVVMIILPRIQLDQIFVKEYINRKQPLLELRELLDGCFRESLVSTSQLFEITSILYFAHGHSGYVEAYTECARNMAISRQGLFSHSNFPLNQLIERQSMLENFITALAAWMQGNRNFSQVVCYISPKTDLDEVQRQLLDVGRCRILSRKEDWFLKVEMTSNVTDDVIVVEYRNRVLRFVDKRYANFIMNSVSSW